MATLIPRRAVLAGLATPFLVLPASARPPFRLHDAPQPLLSPPILDEAGTTRKLSDFAGQVILLNIWASWCPPCREEMPALDRLEDELGGASFMVLPLNIDEDGLTRGRRLYDEIGIQSLPLFWAEPLRVQLAFAFIGLPTSLLIDRQGQEIGRLQGPAVWDSQNAIQQLISIQ